MKTSEKRQLKIQNIVSAGSVAETIDLEHIGNTIPHCTFSKKKFPGAVIHMENPKSAALVFASGRIVLTGQKKIEDIPLALQNLLGLFREAGIPCREVPQLRITNIVCTYDLGFPLNLVRITTELMDTGQVEYEPEAFPGLVCRIKDPKIVFLLFSSGKVVVTGATVIEDAKTGLNVLMDKLNLAVPRIVGNEHVTG